MKYEREYLHFFFSIKFRWNLNGENIENRKKKNERKKEKLDEYMFDE